MDAGNAKAALATRNSSGLSQRLVQDLEAAQQAAQTTLLAEMEQVRRQKATAEERHRRADENVSHPPLLSATFAMSISTRHWSIVGSHD